MEADKYLTVFTELLPWR